MLLEAAAPAPASAARIVKLANGLTVLVQEDGRFPLVSMRLYVHAGSAYENPAEAGISHLLEHMVFKGSEHYAPGALAKAVEKAGGYLNAATSFDHTVYVMDMPSSAWEVGLSALKDMALAPTLSQSEVTREKKVVLAELDRGEDNPDQRLFKTIQKSLWAGTTYEWPIIGYRPSVEKLKAADLKAYVRRLYQPQSMLLVVAGNIKADEVLDKAAKLFGKAANDRSVTLPRPDVLAAGPGPSLTLIRGGYHKAYVAVALPLPALRSPDTPALDVLAHLLGGDRTSRFYRKYKYDTGMVDSISVASLNLQRAGALYINAVMDQDRVPEFWRSILADLAGLKAASFTDDELARAALNLEDSMFQAKETLPGLASKIGHFQFFEGGLEAEEAYLNAVRHTGRAQLDEVIGRYIRPDRLTSAMLLPNNATVSEEALLAEAGKIWPRTGGDKSGHAALRAGTETVDLGAGGKLVLIADPTLPYMSVTITRRGGDSLLDAGAQGLAELTAKAATRGVPGLSANAVQEFLAARAAGLGVTAGRDTFEISAKFPSRFAPDMLNLLGQVESGPSFEPGEVSRAKDDQIAAIRKQEDQPMGLAFRNLFPFLFASGSYSYLRLGQPEDVRAMTPEMVREFWSRQAGLPLVMSVCGTFDREAVTAFAKGLAARAGTAAYNPASQVWSGGAHVKDIKLTDRNQAHVFRIFPVPGLGAPDSAGLSLLESVLSGQGGLLFRELRDGQGLGYSVTAMLWQAPQTGFLAFYIGTSPDKVEQADAAFRKVVEELTAKDLPKAEVDRGRNLLQGDYYRDHQSLTSRSKEAAVNLVRDLPLDWNREVIAQAGKLGPEDLRRLAGKYLLWDKSYIMRIVP